MFVQRRFRTRRAVYVESYFSALSLDVNLFSVCGGCAVDAGIVYAGEHEHLIVRFVADVAGVAHLIHVYLN